MPRERVIVTAMVVVALAAGAAAQPTTALGDHAEASGKRSLDLTALPVGDHKLSTGPKRGYIWACMIGTKPVAPTGPWIHGSTWSFPEKPIVEGSVSQPGSLTVSHSGSMRVFTGNDLPATHTTGSFPSQPGSAAFQYDPGNRNAVVPHSFSVAVPYKPKRAGGTCIGGEAGVLDTGVALFTGFDADGFDAPAHEILDHCSGHPNNAGYHYHSLPDCIATGGKKKHSNRIGYALDGFPLYGPRGEDGEYMKDNDLDACHGHTHEIKFNAKRVRLFHYHVTQQFPYSVGCFRGTASARAVLGGG